MSQRVLILVGIPGSGKSTYCNELMRKEPNKWKRINNDALRAAIDFSVWSSENEKLIKNVREHILKESLMKGYNVVIDNLNLGKRHFDDVCRIVGKLNIDCVVQEKPFFIELEDAIARDALREGAAKVGADVVKKWWKDSGGKLHQHYKARTEEFSKRSHGLDAPFTPAAQNDNAPRAIISDLDGTLALFVVDGVSKRSPYDASQCDITDVPNIPVLETVKLYHANGYKVIFCSGREDKDEAPTRRFIDAHLPGIEYQLFMRKTNDQRKDAIVKEEIFNEHIKDKFNVLLILDDRKQVVDQWRAMGLVCFQVAPGDF